MSMVSGYLIWWHLSSVVVDVYKGSLLTTWLAATSSLAHFATSSSLLLRAPSCGQSLLSRGPAIAEELLCKQEVLRCC